MKRLSEGARARLETNIPENSGYDMALLTDIRILIVDDHPEMNELVKDILTAVGARVSSVGSAAAAFLALQNFRPHLLVCDIGMPEEDGCSFIERVRALSRAAGGELPAVALTAYTRNEDRLKAIVAGFTAYIPKPVRPDELVAVLASLIPQARQHRSALP